MATGAPVGSKALAIEAELGVGSSTIRNELALLEEQGLLSHPHTSAGRVPTDAGYRYFVDQLLREEPDDERPLSLQLMRREVDAAMRTTTETLSQVTDLVAIVTAPPVHTATIRHIEVLVLQPQVLMVVVITSTGGVSKRIFTFERPVDAGLAEWAASYLNERLVGMGLGARMLDARLHDPTLPATEREFLQGLAPAFGALAETAEQTLYVDGAARLVDEHRWDDLSELNALLEMLERRVTLLGDDAGRDPLRLVEVGGVAGRLGELCAGDVGDTEQQGQHDQADAGVLGRCLSALAHEATLRSMWLHGGHRVCQGGQEPLAPVPEVPDPLGT